MSQIEINSKAPDFRLKDVREKMVQLSDFEGKKNVILVFNRGFT